MLRLLLMTLLCFGATSCLYRMPRDDEVVVKPVTNNPSMTRDKGNGMMPGASF